MLKIMILLFVLIAMLIWLDVEVFISQKPYGIAVCFLRSALVSELKIRVLVKIFKKCVRAAHGVHLCYQHLAAIGQKRFVHHHSADYENLFGRVFFYFGKQLFKRADNKAVVALFAFGIENDVKSVFKRFAVRERF